VPFLGKYYCIWKSTLYIIEWIPKKMRISLVVVLLLAVTLSTSFVSYPMKPADAQGFEFDINQDQDNNCFFGSFFICSNIAGIIVSTDGNPPQGSAMLHQTQLNECVGTEDLSDPTLCGNAAGTELFLSASDQAFIESNSEQLTEQTNTCIAGASCENIGSFVGEFFPFDNEFISIVAEDEAVVRADTEQEKFQNNVCEGAFAECVNSGFDLIDIFASDRAIVEANSKQLSEQGSECQDAFCQTQGINFFGISASDQASVEATGDQDIEQGSECQDSAFCLSQGINTFVVSAASDQASVVSNANQEQKVKDSCEDFDTLCQNRGENTLLVEAAGTSTDVNSVSDQTLDIENDCQAGAQCTTDLENSFSLVVQDRDVNSNIKQSGKADNICEGQQVTCTADATNTVNIGGGIGSTPISAEQSTSVSNTVEESNTGGYNIDQALGQNNECTGEGTSCSTTADSTVNIDSSDSGSHNIEQNTQQTNTCDGGSCGNSATSTVNIEDSSGSSPTGADTSSDNQEEPSNVDASISATTASDIGNDESNGDKSSDNNNNNIETTGLTTATSDSESEESSDNGDTGEEIEDNSSDTSSDDDNNESDGRSINCICLRRFRR
jgi:hypothetical protein